MSGPIETEIKLKVASVEAAHEALTRIGARATRARHIEDNLLFDLEGKVLRGRGHLLRLRETPSGAVLTFKGPYRVDGGIKSREEIEAGSADGSALRAILNRLGFLPVFRYQKYRETFAWQGQEIVVDETPIGVFLEIEGDPAGIRAAATALGFAAADYLTDSYAALFRASGGTGDMLF
ncbi:MAG TPA: class IV adenylate cyclase [Vicinamibacteria bacterium]